MTTTHWPGGIRRSSGNGFDLAARRAQGPSIFVGMNTYQSANGKKGGRQSASVVPAVKGLSERAQQQLKATGMHTAITKTDADKARRMRKASI